MKVLITGSSGFLGTRIMNDFSRRYECSGPSHRQLDITDAGSCMRVVALFAPDYVVHTAAVSDTGLCERQPEDAYRINVTGTVNLVKASAAAGSRFIFMSSDQVYHGDYQSDAHRETEDCRPVNEYGKQKLEAEQRVLMCQPEAAVLRLSWLYDLPVSGLDTKANYLTSIIGALKHNTKIAFSDRDYRGVTYVDEVVRNLEQVFHVPGGIYNFGSYGKDSSYMLAGQVFDMLGAADLTDCLLAAKTDLPPRNLSMDSRRQQEHGIFFSGNREGILSCLKEKYRTA